MRRLLKWLKWFCVSVGVIVVLLVVLGALVGDEHHHSPAAPVNALTERQYKNLALGEDDQAFVNRMQATGVPENLVNSRYTRLFPSHGDDLACTYWGVLGKRNLLARLCFSNTTGKLVQKRDHLVSLHPVK
jgi:hypothetical protein